MLHTEKIRKVKLAFANQVIIQHQEDDFQETKPTKQKRKVNIDRYIDLQYIGFR